MSPIMGDSWKCVWKKMKTLKKSTISQLVVFFSFSFFSLQKSENSYKEKIIGNNIIQVSFYTTQ